MGDMGPERSSRSEWAAQVVSFARAEDLLADLALSPPEAGIVRINSAVRDSRPNQYGVGLATASVMLAARRGTEVLVASVVVGHLQIIGGRPGREEEAARLDENLRQACTLLGEQVSGAGFAVRPGLYLIPDTLKLLRSISERLAFREGRAVRREQGPGSNGQAL